MKHRIGIVIVCTGEHYRKTFLSSIISDVKNYFTKHEKEIFLISDVDSWDGIEVAHRISHLPLPLPSLLRHYWMTQIEDQLIKCDYVYYLDVDNQIMRDVPEEIFKPLICVRHWIWPCPGECSRGTFEGNLNSTAFLDNEKAKIYVQASFQGGESKTYLAANRVVSNMINIDLNRGHGWGGIIGRWYDESYWNRFVNDNYDKFAILGPHYALGALSWSTRPELLVEKPVIRLRTKNDLELWAVPEKINF